MSAGKQAEQVLRHERIVKSLAYGILSIALIFSAAMILLYGWDKYQENQQYQRQLAASAGGAVVNDIALMLAAKRRELRRFASDNGLLIGDMLVSSDHNRLSSFLASNLRDAAPDASNLAVLDVSGDIFAEAYRGLVGGLCRQQITRDLARGLGAIPVIHAKSMLVHFDLMTGLGEYFGQSYVLMASYKTDLLIDILFFEQLPDQQMLLVNRLNSDVEISASGDSSWVGVESEALTEQQKNNVLFRQTINGTGWDFWIIADEGAAQALIRQLLMQQLALFLALLLLAGTALLMLRRYANALRLKSRVLHETNEQLEYLTLHDPLTGLANRVLLQEHLHMMISTHTRSGELFAVMIMDLDRFKEVNDTLGHQTGDRLLQQLGERVCQLLREVDTVARLGGDEFGILAKVESEAHAALVASKIMDKVQEPYDIDGSQLALDASIGIALFPEHGRDTDTLIQHADVAMYQAKRAGKAFSLYAAVDNPHSLDRLALMSGLRRAITENQLVLHFQPKVTADCKQVVFVEALVRWYHPKLGLLSPMDFLPLAEQSGAIEPLTEWVILESAKFAVGLRDNACDLSVAVNLSARNLEDEGLPACVQKVLDASGLERKCLQFEITESVMMAEKRRALDVLQQLSDMDIGLSIDDFGTGYSSLAYLSQLPVTELKIDKSFVTNMLSKQNHAIIVKSTIDLAHQLGLVVVAEGVEDESVAHALQDMGCDLLQGYWISKPLPADEMMVWLKAFKPELT